MISSLDALSRRSCVCYGFANLMEALCEAVGVTCTVVKGYAKGDGDSYRFHAQSMAYDSNHNWCCVAVRNPNTGRVGSYLVDPTWCAGHINGSAWVREWNQKYFFADPLAFALTHYPDDQQVAWTLLEPAERPTWRAFITAVKLDAEQVWDPDARILTVSHKSQAIPPVPAGGQLRIVVRWAVWCDRRGRCHKGAG